MLANAMLKNAAGDQQYFLTESATEVLKQHEYRGNIRELRNIVARAMVLTNTNVIDKRVIADSLAAGVEQGSGRAASPEDLSLRAAELRYLHELMDRHDNDKEAVARIAGISLRSLYRKLGQS